jgi:hypothetical protein
MQVGTRVATVKTCTLETLDSYEDSNLHYYSYERLKKTYIRKYFPSASQRTLSCFRHDCAEFRTPNYFNQSSF